MMPFSRTERLLGIDAMQRLAAARVAVFGIGGVGGHAAEALVRSGVGTIDLIDNDVVSVTNLNRQIVATHSTIGQYKVDAMKQRLLDICQEIHVNTHCCFFLPENASNFDFSVYTYVVDAVDTVAAKIEIIRRAVVCGIPVISSMGMGNKLHPELLQLTDISKTSMCPLARVMRKELGIRGIKHVPVVFSPEVPCVPLEETKEETIRRSLPGSTAFVPSVAGLIIAGKVIRDIAGIE
jgi:tRNA A37 threonylcarbamoyladenosine dehydratase